MIQVTLLATLLVTWMVVTTALLYWFYYRRDLVTFPQLVINVLIQFFFPLGFLYSFYLFNKYESRKKSV